MDKVADLEWSNKVAGSRLESYNMVMMDFGNSPKQWEEWQWERDKQLEYDKLEWEHEDDVLENNDKGLKQELDRRQGKTSLIERTEEAINRIYHSPKAGKGLREYLKPKYMHPSKVKQSKW